MMSLFLSTSTHYPGIRPRNQLVPWNLHASMAVLHIIFVIPMTVNDVNLSVAFRGVSGLSS
jgi:hypothetical protein